MKNYLMLLLVLFATGLSAAEFSESFDMVARGFERPANMVTNYFNAEINLELAQQQKDLGFLTDALQELEKKNSNNPVFRFVQGLHAKNMASFSEKMKKPNDVVMWMSLNEKYFVSAMEQDKTNTPHLSAAAYGTMKKSLSDRNKQQAIASELTLGGNGENESYYWYLHWSNINQLQQQGKITEAEDALRKMRSELAEQGEAASSYNQLADKAEYDLGEKKKQLEQNIKPTETKSERDHTAFTEKNVEDKYYYYLAIIAVVMVVIIIVVVLVEMRRRKLKG